MDIRVSISKQCYKAKATPKQISMMVFEPSTINLPIFAELIKNGYNYCHIYNTSASTFTTSEKTIKNFKSTNIVSLDIDNANKPIEDFIGNLTYAPTISYTTPSNNDTEQLYKLRAVYVFEQPITTNEDYQSIYYNLIHQAEADNQFSNSDDSARNVGQYMNGSYGCRMVNNFDKIYKLEDFNFLFENNNDNTSSYYINLKQKKCDTTTTISKSFLNDLNTLEPYEFIKKYKKQYPIFESTPIEYKNGYALLDEDYLEIKRQWTWGSIETANGLSKLYTISKKLRDGQHRRYYLGLAAMIRRKINPNVTLEHLIVNAVYDRYYYYDNSDGELTNKVLIERCSYVMKLKEITIKSYNKKKFMVDKEYWSKLNINPNAAKNIIKKQLNYEFIDTWYDTTISLMDNLRIAKDSDIKIGKDTLYNYCKNRGINTNPNKGKKKSKNSNDNVTDNVTTIENIEYLEPINDYRNLDLVNQLNEMYNQQTMDNNNESNITKAMNTTQFLDKIEILNDKLSKVNDKELLTTNYNKALEWVNKIISKYNLEVNFNDVNEYLTKTYNNRLNYISIISQEVKVISVAHLNHNEIYDLIQHIQSINNTDLLFNGILVKKSDLDLPWELVANKHNELSIKAA